MSDDDFVRETISRLDAEDAELTAQIDKLIGRRSRVRAARGPLHALITEEPATYTGTLANAIRTVLSSHDGSLSPQQVREKVALLGYDLSKHDNVMATIHGVLKSLKDQKQVDAKEWKKEPGVTRYFWIGPREQSITGAHIPSTAKALEASISQAGLIAAASALSSNADVQAALEKFQEPYKLLNEKFKTAFDQMSASGLPKQFEEVQRLYNSSGIQKAFDDMQKVIDAARPLPDVLESLGMKPKK